MLEVTFAETKFSCGQRGEKRVCWKRRESGGESWGVRFEYNVEALDMFVAELSDVIMEQVEFVVQR